MQQSMCTCGLRSQWFFLSFIFVRFHISLYMLSEMMDMNELFCRAVCVFSRRSIDMT